jgi:hypothetical protein
MSAFSYEKIKNKSVRDSGEYQTPNKIQYLTGVGYGETDAISYIACADGNHRVPNVNRNSDGDVKFNLGNFEKPWDDDNVLLCICNSFFLPQLFVCGSFFLQILFPTTKHATDFIE